MIYKCSSVTKAVGLTISFELRIEHKNCLIHYNFSGTILFSGRSYITLPSLRY